LERTIDFTDVYSYYQKVEFTEELDAVLEKHDIYHTEQVLVGWLESPIMLAKELEAKHA
jgi:hypothetical protein